MVTLIKERELVMTVSCKDCRTELLSRAKEAAYDEYQKWKLNREEIVVKFVENFTHSYLFDITPEEMKEVIRETEATGPPLGDIKSTEQIKDIEDFTCPFA